MINLIDTGTKRQLKAARLNVVLLTYCVIVALSVVTVVLLVLFSHWWLDNRIALSQQQKATNDAQTAPYGETRQEAAQFSGNLAKIQSVLTNRSHYSTALLNIAATLPEGASLSSVSFSTAFVKTPLEITAMTPTNEAALALRDKLAKYPIYSTVKLDNVNCGGVNGSACRVTITATLAQSVFTPGATE